MEIGDDKRLTEIAEEISAIAKDEQSDDHTLERRLYAVIEQLDYIWQRWMILGAERRRAMMESGEAGAAERAAKVIGRYEENKNG